MAVSKDHLNKLIQQLPDKALPIAAEFFEKLASKSKNRHIPWDDEPTIPEDIEDINRAS